MQPGFGRSYEVKVTYKIIFCTEPPMILTSPNKLILNTQDLNKIEENSWTIFFLVVCRFTCLFICQSAVYCESKYDIVLRLLSLLEQDKVWWLKYGHSTIAPFIHPVPFIISIYSQDENVRGDFNLAEYLISLKYYRPLILYLCFTHIATCTVQWKLCHQRHTKKTLFYINKYFF